MISPRFRQLVLLAALTIATSLVLGGGALAATFIGVPQPAGYFTHADRATRGAEKFTSQWLRRVHSANKHSLALDGAKHPHVVWSAESDNESTYAVFYAFWDGSKWRGKLNQNAPDQLSVNDLTSIGLSAPSIAIDGAGKPHVAWDQFDDNGHGDYKPFIFYRFWDGTKWTGKAADVDKISDNITGVAAWPDIVVSAQGTPYVLYTENKLPVDVAPDVKLKHWNGSAWTGRTGTAADNLSNSTTWSMVPAIALAGSEMHVAWIEWDNAQSYQVQSVHWDGTRWRGFTNDQPDKVNQVSAENTDSPDIALSQSGVPTIVWTQKVGSSCVINDAYWNGSVWSSYSTRGLVGSTCDYDPVVSVDQNARPVVAWTRWDSQELNILIKRWNGFRWTGLNGKDPTRVNAVAGGFGDPSLALDSLGNPALTWSEQHQDFYEWGVWFTVWVPN